ncbi:MAG TPA: acetate/propionate family kinase [Thermogutta sp.]|nr:acetate/propionate family kinase [Thermogutta sp.]
MKILVVNAGSSSVKFGLFDWETLVPTVRGLVDFNAQPDGAQIVVREGDTVVAQRTSSSKKYRDAVAVALGLLQELHFVASPEEIPAVAHRLIHGGEAIREPVIITQQIKEIIRQFIPLAPLHIPAGLQAIEVTESLFPGAVQTGIFDTAFFAHIPPAAYLYPVPYEWYTEWGIRRFGYHGTSHAYAMERAAQMLGRPVESVHLITCHLGQGSSATAIAEGKAVTNTMGFTPLEGFMMGTRSGTVDPGIITYVQRHHGLTADQVERILHTQSGLLGVSGISGDYREVLRAAQAGHKRSQLALEMYAYRVRAMLGALAVTLGRVDALVFTGGIAENASELRADICRGLECLGLFLNPERNAACQPDADISSDNSPGRILVIRSQEDYILAREAKRLVSANRAGFA